MASRPATRNLIWVPVVVTIVAAIAYGVFTYAVIPSPAAPPPARAPSQPWVLDAEQPWLDQGPRSFDYGTVPFVPSESAHGHTPVAAPPLPNPAALRRPGETARRSP